MTKQDHRDNRTIHLHATITPKRAEEIEAQLLAILTDDGAGKIPYTDEGQAMLQAALERVGLTDVVVTVVKCPHHETPEFGCEPCADRLARRIDVR